MPLFSGNVLPSQELRDCAGEGGSLSNPVSCPKFLATSTVAHQQSALSRVLQEEIRQFEANFFLALEFCMLTCTRLD
jgi:hypothetical protein